MRLLTLSALGLLLVLPAPAPCQRSKRQKKAKPVKCVRLAKAWDAAVTEAKLLRRPIVVHCFGADDVKSNLQHKETLQSRKYIKFSGDHTVEVAVMLELDETPVDGEDEREERKQNELLREYVGKDAARNKVKYLAGFPGLTRAQLGTFGRSGAREYNHAATTPFVTVVDPFTRGEIESITGTYSVDKLIAIATKARRELRKQHGRPKITRADLDRLVALEGTAGTKIKGGKWRSTLDAAERLAKKARAWPKPAIERLRKIADEAKHAARKELDAIEAQAKQSAHSAKKRLLAAWRAFQGTEFFARAEKIKKALTDKLGK